jgi:cytochrome bd-type quinol oxidase subunit 1/mono/diheme cytochrome c family protein
MNYPVWDVPMIGSGWVIGGIAIFHILISHFAIGGGFYLPMAERKAIKEGREDWLEVIKGHSKFFLVLTAVFGAVTGAGIWFSIGLANPEATSTLIHYFVFGWAIEYTFFLVEITAAAVYYYTWDKVSTKTHLRIGWVYAGSAWLSLFVINGILTFMLTPGAAWLSVAGSGNETDMFWAAFFNPTFWPSLFMRTLICISLAGIWALVTASRIDAEAQPRLKTEVVRWSVYWLVPSFLLMPVFFFWYLSNIPADRFQLLQLGIETIGQGTFTQVTRAALVTVITSATILAVVYFFAWRQPRQFTFGHAMAVLFLALAATASTEQAREMIRKPYVIGEHMYSNGMRRSDIKRINEEGYLTKSPWVRPAEREAWAKADAEGDMRLAIDGSGMPATEQLARGELMFRGQCMACHTVDGYRSMRRLLAGRDRQAVGNILGMLHNFDPEAEPAADGALNYHAYMPPIAGTKQEVEALGDYLYYTIAGGKAPETPAQIAIAQ